MGYLTGKSALDALLNSAIELLAVAELRGDDELPCPAGDDKLWTARMQDAWNDLREQVEATSPDAIGILVSDILRKIK